MRDRVRAAALQFNPVYLSRDGTIDLVRSLVLEAAEGGAELVVTPECSIPMYPIRDPNLAVGSQHERYFDVLLRESVTIPGPATEILGRTAQQAHVCLVAGVNERTQAGAMFNSAIIFDADGSIIGVHRKITPVLHERLYHSAGGSESLRTFNTSVGVIGVGICFENLHPLYRHALLAAGEEIHCALWVSVPKDRHLMQTSARQHAAEGAVWVVAAGQVTGEGRGHPTNVEQDDEFVGGSLIVAPGGRVVAGPVFGQSCNLTATIESSAITRARESFAILGDQQRADLFPI